MRARYFTTQHGGLTQPGCDCVGNQVLPEAAAIKAQMRGSSERTTRVLNRAVTANPVVAIGGAGVRLILSDGREVIDGSSGPAASCLGHGHPRVVNAICHQAQRLDYAHVGQFSSEPAEALAEALVKSSQGAFSRVLFATSGSEAIEISLKLARQYFVEKAEPRRTCVIARRQSYHGATMGALALSGHIARRSVFEPMLSTLVTHVSPCFAYHYKGESETDAEYVARLRDELEEEIQAVGPDRVMAFCAETLVGATAGCVPAVPGYFRAIRELCDEYGILLILDEVMCGMGRTGSWHAWQQEGVRPDIQAVAKGLAGGCQPLGAVLLGDRLMDALALGSGVIAHGQTYQSHPIACAAALEVHKVIVEDRLLENVQQMGRLLEGQLKAAFADHGCVGDIRGRGLFWAVEFLSDKVAKQPFPVEYRLADRVQAHALNAGLAVYPSSGTIDGISGDHVIVAPPFIVKPPEIHEIVNRLLAGVNSAVRELTVNAA